VLLRNKFSKLNELFCNYKETFYVLVTNHKIVGQKYTFNKKRSVESSRNVCSADLDDSLGKEELYLSKVIIYDV
jgi:hypothetical protein